MMTTHSSVRYESRAGDTGRSLFRNLFFAMIGFGVMVGMAFPPFAKLVLDSDRALSFQFFVLCVLAGFAVGAMNFLIFSMVVSRHLGYVAEGMRHVLDRLREAESGGEMCTEECGIAVTSDDAIGSIQRAFNALTEAIAHYVGLESVTKRLHTEMAASVEVEQVSEVLLGALNSAAEAQAGLLYGDTGEAFELLANQGADEGEELPKRLDKGQGPIQQAMRSGRVIALSAAADHLSWIQRSTPLGSFRPQSLIAVPLMGKANVVGVAVLASRAERLTADTHAILETLGKEGAPYLESAILHRKLRDLAALDDLTRILNRRFGVRRLSEEFSRAVRHGTPLSVLFIDIDHFKTFNDTFGHDAGDEVLKRVAAELEGHIRSGDVACRYGGEEFMIVAPGTGMKDAARLGERLRRIVQAAALPWGQKELSVTISVGLATWPVEQASVADELVSAADEALYAAKRAGRNRLFVMQVGRAIPASDLI